MKTFKVSFTTSPPKLTKYQHLSKRTMTTAKGFHSVHEKMTFFHDSYRSRFSAIQKDAERLTTSSEVENFRKQCESFIQDVDTHHTIEELHVFPVLGAKMPEFKSVMLDEHKDMVSTLHRFSELLKVLDHNKSNQDLAKVLSEVHTSLFKHLEEEEKLLEAENMKKYWTLEEISTFKFV